MGDSLLEGEGLSLRYDKGTVGEYLQKGRAGLSARNAWQLAFLLALLSGALCAFVCLYDSRLDEVLGLLLGVTVVSAESKPVFCAISAVSVALGVVLLVVSFRKRGKQRDRRHQLRAQVLTMMVRNARYPVGMKTQLSVIGLRCLYIKGRRAMECTSRYAFMPEDFPHGSLSARAAAQSLFGAYDYEVLNGRLYVYYDEESAEEIRERRYRKGTSHG